MAVKKWRTAVAAPVLPSLSVTLPPTAGDTVSVLTNVGVQVNVCDMEAVHPIPVAAYHE